MVNVPTLPIPENNKIINSKTAIDDEYDCQCRLSYLYQDGLVLTGVMLVFLVHALFPLGKILLGLHFFFWQQRLKKKQKTRQSLKP